MSPVRVVVLGIVFTLCGIATASARSALTSSRTTTTSRNAAISKSPSPVRPAFRKRIKVSIPPHGWS